MNARRQYIIYRVIYRINKGQRICITIDYLEGVLTLIEDHRSYSKQWNAYYYNKENHCEKCS